MPHRTRHLHLNLVGNPNTQHDGVHALSRAFGNPPQSSAIDLYIDYARIAEEGNFTSFFLGDTAGMMGAPVADGGTPEPVTALTAAAGATKHLGLVATVSTTFYDPYNAARLIGSLDLVSDGRAGVNAVTSASDIAALNYSLDGHPDRAARYDRAEEFIHVVKALWDGRELRADEHGLGQLLAEPINHEGRYFRVRGPLNVAPSRQGAPLISQAGGSGTGIRVAAKYADLTFTNANSKEDAAAYKAELRAALREVGRPLDDLPVLPGVAPYLGRSAREAQERKDALDQYLDLDALAPRALAAFGIQYSYDSIDDKFPVDVLPHPLEVKDTVKNSFGNYLGLYTWIMNNPGVTVGQVAAQTAGGWTHRKFVGSYDEFADDLASWFDEGLAAGFSLIAPQGVASVREMVDEIVPRLIDRGIYRTTPDDRPLRQRFAGDPA